MHVSRPHRCGADAVVVDKEPHSIVVVRFLRVHMPSFKTICVRQILLHAYLASFSFVAVCDS